jgi:hypothetical protein
MDRAERKGNDTNNDSLDSMIGKHREETRSPQRAEIMTVKHIANSRCSQVVSGVRIFQQTNQNVNSIEAL